MPKLKHRFTWIEKLALIIITGIWVVILWPLGEKVVERIYIADAKKMMQSIQTASQNYYEQTGKEPEDFSQLNVLFTDETGKPATGPSFSTKNWTFRLYSCKNVFTATAYTGPGAVAERTNSPNEYSLIYCQGRGFRCGGAEKICKKVGFDKMESVLCVSDGCYME